MNYYAPDTLPQLLDYLHSQRERSPTILAGGTDILPRRNCRRELHGWVDKPRQSLLGKEEEIVYIGNTGLDRLVEEGAGVRIGACVTITALTRHPLIGERYPVLKEAALQMASPAIRNTATIGGNIANASPAGDAIQALLVLDAAVVLVSVEGERQIPLCEFFAGPGKTVAGPGELVKEIVLPPPRGNASFQKLGQRRADTLSVVNSAARVVVEDGVIREARVSVGAVAPKPLRLTRMEEMLTGRAATRETIQAAARAVAGEIAPISDQRSSAAYRKRVAPVLVERALLCACGLNTEGGSEENG